jgi:hypothetical protein
VRQLVDISNEELRRLITKFEDMFDDVVPLLMLPARETTEGLKQKIILCLADRKNRLAELYKFDYENEKY